MACVSVCTSITDPGTYAVTTTPLKCVSCTASIPNCGTCTNSSKCLTCINSMFLKSDGSACVADCLVSDLGYFFLKYSLKY